MNWQRLEPSWLPPGTVVGPWKIKRLHARVAFGVVFRAVLARRAHGGPVALKFALRPRDPRFQRESELLGRIQHPSKELNPRVAQALGALILRALSEQAAERPSAGELAEALEEAGRQQDADLDVPLFANEPVAVRQGQTRRALPRWAGYAACTVLGGLLTGAGWWLSVAIPARASRSEGTATALGDTRLPPALARQDTASGGRRLAQPLPKTPLDGQRRAPDCLPPPMEVTINGGCWMEVPTAKPPCPSPSYEWKGGCYMPDVVPQRKPTSETPP